MARSGESKVWHVEGGLPSMRPVYRLWDRQARARRLYANTKEREKHYWSYLETWNRWNFWGHSASFCSLKSFSFELPSIHRTVLRCCSCAMHAVFGWLSYCSFYRPCFLFVWGLGAEVSYSASEIYRIYPCLRQSGRVDCEALRPANCSPVLFLKSMKNEGFRVTTWWYISSTVTAWLGWKLSQNLSDGAATERPGACDVAKSMSALSGKVKALCVAGVAIAVSVAVVTLEQLLQLKFSVQSFATARPLHFTWKYL